MAFKERWVCHHALVAGGSSCTVSLGKKILGTQLTDADAKAIFSGRKTRLKSFQSKEGKPFKAMLGLSSTGKLLFEYEGKKS